MLETSGQLSQTSPLVSCGLVKIIMVGIFLSNLFLVLFIGQVDSCFYFRLFVNIRKSNFPHSLSDGVIKSLFKLSWTAKNKK